MVLLHENLYLNLDSYGLHINWARMFMRKIKYTGASTQKLKEIYILHESLTFPCFLLSSCLSTFLFSALVEAAAVQQSGKIAPVATPSAPCPASPYGSMAKASTNQTKDRAIHEAAQASTRASSSLSELPVIQKEAAA